MAGQSKGLGSRTGSSAGALSQLAHAFSHPDSLSIHCVSDTEQRWKTPPKISPRSSQSSEEDPSEPRADVWEGGGDVCEAQAGPTAPPVVAVSCSQRGEEAVTAALLCWQRAELAPLYLSTSSSCTTLGKFYSLHSWPHVCT